MRNITLTLCLIIATLSLAQTQPPPFLEKLGKEVNQPIECFCSDRSGDLTVGYYKSATSDQLIFKKWMAVTKQWDSINMISSVRIPSRNFTKCLYYKDSLLLTTGYVKDGKTSLGIFYLPNRNATPALMSEFKADKGRDLFISDLRVIKNRLTVFGSFDSIYTSLKGWIRISNAAIYELSGIADLWEFRAKGISTEKLRIANLPMATLNDTTLIISEDRASIFRFIFPDQLKAILEPSVGKGSYSNVATIGNRWIITKPNSDTIIFYNGIDFKERKLNRSLTENLSIVNTNKGLLIAEDSKELSWLYKLDIEKNRLLIIRQSLRTNIGIPKTALIYSEISKNTFYRFNIPIKHAGIVYENVAQIVDIDWALKFKNVTAYLFIDRNRDYKKNGNDEMVKGQLFNRTLGYLLPISTGKFFDTIPFWIDAEYQLINFASGECIKLPFSGAVRTNTVKGVVDDLYFPLQLSKIPKNINVKSWGKATARLMDTIPLTIKVYSSDCSNSPSNVKVTVELDSHTRVISSSPFITSKIGQILVYDFVNIKANRDTIIRLNVVYPYPEYKIDKYVRHHVKINTITKDDSLDNNDSIVQKLVGSYDPNAKYSIPQGIIVSDLKHIRYYIEFQNEGNDVARRVTVADTLDTHTPVYEFQMVAASHAYSVSLQNNVVTWVFDNINLPGKKVDEKGSQGYVIFDAKVISNIGIGDSIRNKAYIYFDYNDPIITNISIISRIEDLPIVDESDNSFRVFPNPATANVTIENKINIFQEVKIFNILGQEIEDIKLDPIGKTIRSISSWPKGMYFIKSTKGNFQKFLVH